MWPPGKLRTTLEYLIEEKDKLILAIATKENNDSFDYPKSYEFN